MQKTLDRFVARFGRAPVGNGPRLVVVIESPVDDATLRMLANSFDGQLGDAEIDGERRTVLRLPGVVRAMVLHAVRQLGIDATVYNERNGCLSASIRIMAYTKAIR